MDETQQTLPPIPPQSSHNHKILWILLGVVILLLVAGILVFQYGIFIEKSVNNIEKVATTTDEFAGWKTYRNEEYGFELKYPYNLGVEFNHPRKGESTLDRFYITDPNFDYTEKIGQERNEIDQVAFDIYPYTKESFEKKTKEYKTGGSAGEGVPESCKKIPPETIIKSQSGEIRVYEIPCGLAGPFLEGHFHNEKYIFRVSAVWHEELAYKILSTFKFISTSTEDISTWMTYRNEEYGFEFKYPSDWTINTGIDGPINNKYLYINLFSPNNDGSFSVLVNFSKPGTDLSKWIIDNSPTDPSGENKLTREIGSIDFNGLPAKEASSFNFDSRSKIIIFQKDSNIFSLKHDKSNPNDKEFENHLLIYNKILSTFKFTK